MVHEYTYNDFEHSAGKLFSLKPKSVVAYNGRTGYSRKKSVTSMQDLLKLKNPREVRFELKINNEYAGVLFNIGKHSAYISTSNESDMLHVSNMIEGEIVDGRCIRTSVS